MTLTPHLTADATLHGAIDSAERSGPVRRRLADLVRSAAFVYLVAVIMVVGSERFFWYWSTSLLAQFEGALFYAVATAAGLALMRRYRVTDWWSAVLVTPVIAFVVEGVITPIIYSAGPFVPFFPAWFSFWHGILAFMGLVFGLRHLALHRPKWMTALAAVGLGVFWGLWSMTSLLPENVNDEELIPHHGGSLEILDPTQFAVYAATMTAVLIVGHAVIGFVWPSAGRSSGRTGRLGGREGLVVAVCLFFAGAWTLAYPWALPMFLVYCWLQIKALRWHRSATPSEAPSLLDRLQGRPRLTALAPLALMAPAAALTYQLLWSASLSDTALRVIMYGTIVLQALAGAALVVIALVRARRLRASKSDASEEPSVPSHSGGPEATPVSP